MNPTATKKRKETFASLSKRINLLMDIIAVQIPQDDTSGYDSGSQSMQSIWNEEEMEILKTKLLDLSQKI